MGSMSGSLNTTFPDLFLWWQHAIATLFEMLTGIKLI